MTDWILKHRFLAVALALVLVQLLFRWWWALDGYFWQDDFRYLAQASDGLTIDSLLQDYNGHLMPGSFAVSRLVVALGSSYAVALTIVLLMQTTASLLLVWVVDLLFPRRLLSLVVLAAAMFTPLTLVGVSWYAYSLQLWPVQAAMLACAGGYLKWRQTRAWRWLLLVTVSYAVGLFFWEKALLIPGVLVLLAVLVLDRRQGFILRLKELVRQWELWLPMIAITIGYAAIYLSRTASIGGEGESAQKSIDIAAFLDNGLLRTLLPGLLGGPWTNADSIFTVGATPGAVATVLSAVVWLAIILISVVRRPTSAAQAWLWVVTIVVIDYGLLVAFRPTADVLARDSRYIADAIPVVAVGVLAAMLPLRGEADPATSGEGRVAGARRVMADLLRPRLHRRVVAAGAALMLLAGAAFSTIAMGGGMRHASSRVYVNALKESVESDSGRVMLDSGAPYPGVFFGSVEELSRGLGLGAEFADAGQDLKMFDARGRPRSVGVRDASFEQKGPRTGCGWLLQPERPVEVKTGQKQIRWPHRVLQIGYFGKQPHSVTVTVDGKKRATLPAADGLGVLTVRVPTMPQKIRLSVETPGASLCITELTVGIATPKKS